MAARSHRAGSLVLDAWALLAWLGGQRAAKRVRQVLRRADVTRAPLHLSVINAGEVYYRLARVAGQDQADAFLADLRGGRFPIRLEGATPRRVWDAARLKIRYALSYADAFAAALARELDVPILTGDPEIRALDEAGECRVEWLPQPSSGSGRREETSC
jgi:predicted nucleic acid-binding protein